MQNQKVLEQLGYSSNEAKVYLATLALGEGHISDIAERVKMPRSTVQVILERLHEDGLVNFYVMRRYKYWIAEDPACLLERLKDQQTLVEEALPGLRTIKQNARKHLHAITKLEDLGPLKEVADGIQQSVLIADIEKEIRYVNSSWEKLFGYDCDEVMGQNTRILKTGKTPQIEYDRLLRALKAGKLFESSALVDQKKNGEQLTIFTTIFPVRHGNRTFYVQILEERPRENDKAKELKQVFYDALALTV